MPGPPIRKPSDHSPPAGSPRNIAGHHVLHRPLMPRHPPNAHKNKQHNTRQNTCRRLTVRCSRPLYSSQPTHPHPPPPLQQTEKQKKRARQPGRTAPEPRQHATPNKRGHPPPPNQAAAGASPMPAPGNQPHPSTHHTGKTPEHQPATLLSAGSNPPAGPDPPTAQTRSNDQEATPTQPILRKEVIQPHLPVRLPCYDFVPITSPTFDRSP